MGQLVSLRLGLQTQVVTQWVWVCQVSGQVPLPVQRGMWGTGTCSAPPALAPTGWEGAHGRKTLSVL